MAKRFLEGLKKAPDGRYILRENISLQSESIKKVPLKETEIKEIQEKKADFDGKTKYIIKVWDRGFNANERSYSQVIDRVVKENKRTVGLMNHPEEEPDPEKIFAVEKNPFIDEDGWLSVELYPCGFWGQMIEDVIQNDGPITVSSACLGNLDDNGYVINDETFELERYFDFVFGPSNRLNQYQNSTEKREDDGSVSPVSNKGIFGITEKENSSEVKLARDNASEIANTNTNKGENKLMPEQKDLLETTMKMNIRSMVKEADKTESLSEKKEILTSAHSYASQLADTKLTEEIQNEIAKVEEEIKVLTEKGQKSDELQNSVDSLMEEKKLLEKEVVSLEKEKEKLEAQLKTISNLYEKKQYKSSESEQLKSQRLAKEVCSLKMKNRRYEMEMNRLSQGKKLAERKAYLSKAEANTKASAEVVQALQEENAKLKNRNKELSRQLRESRSRNMRNDRIGRDEVRSRFQSIRQRVEENRSLLNKDIPSNSSITESSVPVATAPSSNGFELDEDTKMEMMLNHQFN